MGEKLYIFAQWSGNDDSNIKAIFTFHLFYNLVKYRFHTTLQFSESVLCSCSVPR